MEYVCYRNYKGKGISGDIELKKGAKLQTTGQLILYKDKPVSTINSQFTYDTFARNDDNRGLKRSELTHKIRIRAALKFSPDEFIEKYKDNPKFSKFRLQESESAWKWNHDFFNAEIDDLVCILNEITEDSRKRG